LQGTILSKRKEGRTGQRVHHGMISPTAKKGAEKKSSHEFLERGQDNYSVKRMCSGQHDIKNGSLTLQAAWGGKEAGKKKNPLLRIKTSRI